MNIPICPYCEQPSKLVKGNAIYPRRRDLYPLKFFMCSPCDAYVGTHKRTGKPLGTLANASLRNYRKRVHATFDPVWKQGTMKRGEAYVAFAKLMGISTDDCHIALFNEEQCIEALVRLPDLT